MVVTVKGSLARVMSEGEEAAMYIMTSLANVQE
jgi:hypothetical protein